MFIYIKGYYWIKSYPTVIGGAHLAELVREENELVLKLRPIEKVEGVHGDIRVPISAVQAVTVIDDVIHAVHGIKLPGSLC